MTRYAVPDTGKSADKWPAILPQMRAEKADKNLKFENTVLMGTENQILMCTPPCMGNTIAAVFLHIGCMSVKYLYCLLHAGISAKGLHLLFLNKYWNKTGVILGYVWFSGSLSNHFTSALLKVKKNSRPENRAGTSLQLYLIYFLFVCFFQQR